jgi:hypothetical protein
MLTQEQVNKLLEDSKPAMIECFKKEVMQSVTWDVKATIGKELTAHVQKWIQENVIPEVTRQLVESKDGLIALGVAIAPQMVEAFTEAAIKDFKRKLESSWEREKLFKALFA